MKAPAAPCSAQETCRELTVIVHDDLGLHARPAARIAQAALEFSCEVSLTHDGNTIDAKSILDILSLAAARGASLTLRCQGADAASAAGVLAELFSRPLAAEER